MEKQRRMWSSDVVKGRKKKKKETVFYFDDGPNPSFKELFINGTCLNNGSSLP